MAIKLTDHKSISDDILLTCQQGLVALKKRKDLGYLTLPSEDHLWDQCTARGEKLKEKYGHLAVVGIGGSSLGGRALLEGCGFGSDANAPVTFFENVDGASFHSKINAMGALESVHWVMISKSGSTLETLAQGEYIHQVLREHGLALAEQATIISEQRESTLTKWANKNGVHQLELPANVGGRFSVLSPVGILPASFCGIDVSKIKTGASAMGERDELVASFAALLLSSLRNEKWITYFWSYSDFLRSFGQWVQQLWAESLAKEVRLDGEVGPRVSVPVPLVGANDQHSVLQQIVAGHKDSFAVFLRSQESENFGTLLKENIFSELDFLLQQKMGQVLAAEADATREALAEVGVESLTLTLNGSKEEDMGALFMLFQLAVGVLGEVFAINAYDQPGVELGKRLAREKLSSPPLMKK